MNIPLIVVLAGGVGKRFAPISIDKTLLPFLGKPVLQHTLEMLERTNCKDVLITTNKENNAWLEHYKSSTSLSITTKLQLEPLGMGNALRNLENEINNRPVIIMNAGDVVEDTLLLDLLQQSKDAYALVTGMKVVEHLPVGYLQTDGNKVISVVEKPEAGKEPSDLINLVFHYFSAPQDFIARIKQIETDNDDQYEQALSSLMQDHEIKYVSYQGYWQKLKYSHNVLDMTQLFLNKIDGYISPSAQISDKAVIGNDVYIEEGVKVFEGAVIKGPAYIGKNVVVGNNVLIRESIVEENTVVGFGSEVARSYLGPRCMLHHNFIGDSVLESDINPSYGTCTTNMRLDNQLVAAKLLDTKVPTNKHKLGAIIAKGVFSGVNCIFLPGVTIGENAKIYPGTIIHSAVPAYATVKTYQEQTVIMNEKEV